MLAVVRQCTENLRSIESVIVSRPGRLQHMPHVTLDLVSLDNEPLVGKSQRFEGNGGTIGRDAGNTLPLPDQHRRVSRLHAAISFPNGAPTITNSSTVLPIHVGGVQLQCGQAKVL